MLKRKRILIVDDEEDMSWGIARNLERTCEEVEVGHVQSAEQALQMLKRKRFDLVVSDLRMPGRDGLDLLMEVRRKFPQTKLILMTAYGSREVAEAADKRGSFFYLEKPFDMSHLKQVIVQALNLQKSGFKGYLHSAGIRELVEFTCTTRRTTTLMVKKGRERGRIDFKDGAIIHAECGNLTGERALMKILNWSRGSFRISHGVTAKKRTILKDWRALLYRYA